MLHGTPFDVKYLWMLPLCPYAVLKCLEGSHFVFIMPMRPGGCQRGINNVHPVNSVTQAEVFPVSQPVQSQEAQA